MLHSVTLLRNIIWFSVVEYKGNIYIFFCPETRSLRGKIFGVFQNKLPRKVFGAEREQVRRVGLKLHNEERHDLYSFRSPHLFYPLTVRVEFVYFHLITLRHKPVGRTPLDKWSARRRDLYLTTQTLTRDRHPYPQRDSNSQSQQASDRRPTP
jgi:hypothetical protein